MATEVAIRGAARTRIQPARETGNHLLRGLCAVAGLLALAVLVDIVVQVFSGAQPALDRFGLGFLGHVAWQPNFFRLGAATMLYGTFVTSAMALVLAVPLGVAIALWLAMIAPRPVAVIVGPMVEMLAAIPSVIVGFWGVIVLAPYVHLHVEPFLHDTLGFLPIFGPPQTTGLSLFSCGVVLAFMVLPIVASLSRDLFLTVPRELREGAEALGATRWEVIRGIVLPTTAAGVGASVVLALGRALGEAIAIAELCGTASQIHTSLFTTGNSLAARIATDIPSVENNLHQAGLFYLAAILLVIGLITNVIAQYIARRFTLNSGMGIGR